MNQQRYTQFLRLFYIAESLRGLRYGLGLSDLREKVSDRMGQQWSERSISRDLQALDGLALVTQTDNQRWRWNAPVSLLDHPPCQKNAPAVTGHPALAGIDLLDIETGEVHRTRVRLHELHGEDGETFGEVFCNLYRDSKFLIERGMLPIPRIVRLSGKAVHHE